MKKTLFFLGAFAVLTAGVSCKKDYDCECTVTDSSGTIPTTKSHSTILNTTKKKAKEACEKNNVTIGTVTSSDCKLQ